MLKGWFESPLHGAFMKQATNDSAVNCGNYIGTVHTHLCRLDSALIQLGSGLASSAKLLSNHCVSPAPPVALLVFLFYRSQRCQCPSARQTSPGSWSPSASPVSPAPSQAAHPHTSCISTTFFSDQRWLLQRARRSDLCRPADP